MTTQREQLEADVLIVGGGITGITTAYLLKRAGCRVALVDLNNIGGGETAHTTAHLTFVADTRLHELASQLGRERAQAGAGRQRVATYPLRARTLNPGLVTRTRML